MSLKYIREKYRVPAFKGRRVKVLAVGYHEGKEGQIVSSKGPYVGIRIDREKKSIRVHPQEVDYLLSDTEIRQAHLEKAKRCIAFASLGL